jgi:NDP-sugar pyrophosphorylase family protein
MKAMILAAGLGTRLRPLTNTIPKALILLNRITLLERTIKKISLPGFDEIIINVHHYPEQIRNFLKQNKNFGLNISISDEADELLDTGGGLKKAASFFNDAEPFLLHNVDVLTDLNLNELLNSHKKNNSIATLAVMKRESSRQFLFDDEMNLCGWQNRKTSEKKISRQKVTPFQQFAFCGIQIIDPAIFHFFPQENKFSLIDFYIQVSREKTIKGLLTNSKYFYDLGSIDKLNEAEKFISQIKS